MKAFLTWHDRPFEKTHHLKELVGQCQDIEPEFGQFLDGAELLSPFAVEVRYPDEIPEPTLETAQTAGRLTRQAVDFVLRRLPDQARP